MSWLLFLDDERHPESSIEDDGYRAGVGLRPVQPELRLLQRPWIVARSVEEALDLVWRMGMPTFIAFDHDLGDGMRTGHDLAHCLVELDMDGAMEFPPGFSYEVHSANPVGRSNIVGLLENYLEFKRAERRSRP